LNKTQKNVLREISKLPSITNIEIANKLGITDRTVRRCIELLKINGIIQRVGPDKGGRWKVIYKAKII